MLALRAEDAMGKFTNALMRLLIVGMLVAVNICAAAPYPTRPVRFISPNTPGGGTTLLARLISPKLTERLGQQVIADNRPGGNGIIGGEFGARSSRTPISRLRNSIPYQL